MEAERTAVEPLQLRERDGRKKHWLSQRPVNGGDIVEVCFSGGWLAMRYEWNGLDRPRCRARWRPGLGELARVAGGRAHALAAFVSALGGLMGQPLKAFRSRSRPE